MTLIETILLLLLNVIQLINFKFCFLFFFLNFEYKGCKTNEITNDKEETVSTSLSSTINKSSRSPSPSQYSNRSYLIQQQHQQKKNSDLKALPSMQILPPPPPTPSNTRSHLPSVIPPPPPPVNSNPSINGAKQLNKLKRFLTTLQQFASDISPEINERVKNLILNLIVSLVFRIKKKKIFIIF